MCALPIYTTLSSITLIGKCEETEDSSYTRVRDGKEETLLGMVFICKDCADEMDRKAKAKIVDRVIGSLICALVLYGFFEKWKSVGQGQTPLICSYDRGEGLGILRDL